MPKKKLTQERLKKLFYYETETGVFFRIRSKQRGVVGEPVGWKNKNGYLVIGIDYKTYLAHRLAWFYVYGYLPEYGLDHINGNPSDNRIKNLREVSQRCNARNCKLYKNNRSGVKGVTLHKLDNNWESKISVNRKSIFLGRYKSFENAVCARLAAEQCLNWNNCDSNSPAYKYVKENINEKLH